MNDVLSWLYDYCSQNDIMIQHINYLGSHAPSMAYTYPRLITFNDSWYNDDEKPFMLAHEIGHVMCGTTICYDTQNHKLSISKNECEHDANIFAIKLFKKYCAENGIHYDNAVQFAEAFAIPKKCFYLLEKV